MSLIEMPRKYAVLKQFTQDLDRLLKDAETGFAGLKAQPNPSQAEILAVYRPVHNLKGICGMVEETKLLVRAFHALEDSLPPLISVRKLKKAEKNEDWTSIATATFQMAREVERILLAKLALWKKLGADENEVRGLLFRFTDSGTPVRAWVGITALVGLVDATEVRGEKTVGLRANDGEALLVEMAEGMVTVYIDEIECTCTRLEAMKKGVPAAFKEWWAAEQKRRGLTAA
jgi:hypothetical protein